MNMQQRRAHRTLWSIVMIVLLALIGATLIVRERVAEASTAINAGKR